MMSKWNSIFQAAVISFLLWSPLRYVSAADSLVIDESELAQESVLPRFDRSQSVKNRNVITDRKFELGLYYGWNTLEPILNQNKMGLNLGYHLSEESALMLNMAMWSQGLNTQYTDSLADRSNLDFTRAPQLKYSVYANYEWKVFYGKISVTKKGVINLSTYPIFGIGTSGYEHKNYFGVDVGVGQKFYFTKNFALRADFKFQYQQKPSPFLEGKMSASLPDRPSPGEFKDIWDWGNVLDVGASFLF